MRHVGGFGCTIFRFLFLSTDFEGEAWALPGKGWAEIGVDGRPGWEMDSVCASILIATPSQLSQQACVGAMK